ncbi:DeoR family transcriptional regulator [Lactobacillus selangorensis]|uniref:DeoR family transcriptional regulator n=1 Tax=Lactobacillus selangorensis TaxID=81857 RepID=A0A0R2FH65_9LACO|nr:DeoR/GlpR family DNA-binding transcription regulator [Lactobacillus selangorensis]KRN27961.1 DeoR family transcriptional regulator [Lactobacillus selangorensis]KRN30568.1 DeoR family transcriptional regulator [Lactobacillus selangorensis]
MNANEIQARRNQILALLKKDKTVKISELVSRFKVSDETIRKDLTILSDQGLVHKQFGKATIVDAPPLAPVNQRTTINTFAKNKIADKAFDFLPAKRITMALDQGSTVASLAALIAKRDRDTIITSSLLSLIALQNSHEEIFSTGGKYSINDMSFQGDQTYNLYTDTYFDFSFVGSSGVLGRDGICSSNFADAEMKRKMIANSNVCIALVDATKFKQSSLVKVAGWDQVDYVITDLPSDDPALTDIQKETHVISTN